MSLLPLGNLGNVISTITNQATNQSAQGSGQSSGPAGFLQTFGNLNTISQAGMPGGLLGAAAASLVVGIIGPNPNLQSSNNADDSSNTEQSA